MVRHAEDHVHIAAVLVRLDTGRRVHPKFDHRTLRQVCRETETRLGLVATADADRTAPRYPTRAEQEKAARRTATAGPSGDITGGRTAREFLCDQARRASLLTRSPEEFLEQLASPAIRVRVHRDQAGRIDGYALALVGDRNTDGEPVWFSGSRLARDLSMPRLQAVWASATGPSPDSSARIGALDQATRAVDDAADAVNHEREVDQNTATHDGEPARGPGETAAGIAHSLRDLLVALDLTARDAYPDLGDAARLFDRAARTPHTVLPGRWSDEARHLRTAAWRLAAVRALPGHGPDRAPLAALVAAVATLVVELAALHATKQRLAQARAAHRCADALTVSGEAPRREPHPRGDGITPPRRAPTVPWAVAQASRSAAPPRSRRTSPSGPAPRPSPPPSTPHPGRRPGPSRGR